MINIKNLNLEDLYELEGFYIWYLKDLNKYYLGESSNIKRRFNDHLNGSNVPEIKEEFDKGNEIYFQYTYLPGFTKDERLDVEDYWKDYYKKKVGWDNLLNKCDFREDSTVRKEVYQFNEYGEFLASYRSVTACAKKLGYKVGTISEACREYRFYYGNFWMYKDDYTPIKLKSIIENYKFSGGLPVLSFGKDKHLVKRYESASEAARDLKTSQANISLAAKNFKSCKGRIWIYEYEYSKTFLEEKFRKTSILNKDGGKPICQFDLQGRLLKTYKSASEASRQVGISSNNISNCANGKTATSAKCLWRWEEDVLLSPKVNLDKPGNIFKLDRKTGEILDRYETVLDAGIDNGLQPGDISKVLNNRRNSCGGFNFVYSDSIEDG